MPELILTPAEAAARLNVPEVRLRNWRRFNKGPASFRLGGRIRYTAADLDAWVTEQRANARGGHTNAAA
jgi:hypothetical protein